jgi:hypothetical protein
VSAATARALEVERATRRLEAELGRAEGLGASDPIVLPAWAAVALVRHLREQLATPRARNRPGLAVRA